MNVNVKYDACLYELQMEFAKFVNKSEKAKTSNRGRIALSARKSSILLRKLLKEFRKVSIENQKEIKNAKK